MTTTGDHGCKCKCTPRACLHVEGRIRGPCTCTPGRLAPWTEPVTGALGWQVTTLSRRLAAVIAETISGGKVFTHEKDEWQVRIPQAVLMATAINVDTTACTLSIEPHPAAFTLTFAPWPATTFLKCPVTVLPARGTLSVNDVRTTTRMGRTVRYLVPVFTLSGEIS